MLDPLSLDVEEETYGVAIGEDALFSTEDADFRKKTNTKSVAKEIFPYDTEWKKVCEEKIETISMWALQGYLSSSRFRSLCWMRFLEIIPNDCTKWLTQLRSRRQEYEKTRYNLMSLPLCESASVNLAINNPLSQDQASPWYKHFEQMELKKEIRTDVDRTMPDNDFFQMKKIQDLMVTVLFCYARKYVHFSYIQGMHEILAILIHALNNDRETYKKHIKVAGDITTLQEVMDEQYLEHDSFLLFEAVMNGLHPWYDKGNDKMDQVKVPVIYGKPISGCENVGPTAKAVHKLLQIHDKILQRFDPEVYNQLQKLEVIPQIYGIRWTRLMFGREFSLQSVLTLWDAIFSDSSSTFSLIDYIIVAMLVHIRDDILTSDFSRVISILMRFPQDTDGRSIIKMAVEFRNKFTQNLPVETGLSLNLLKNINSPKTERELARSTSVPRRPESFSGSKQRSTSVEHRTVIQPRTESPTVETHQSTVSFSKPQPVSNGRQSTEEKWNSASGKKPRFSTMFARQKDAESSDPECMERPMEELCVVKKSRPIPTSQMDRTAYSSEEEAERMPRIINKRRSSSEELMVVNRNCAQRLKGLEETLTSRLDQLHLESDLPMRSVMESLREVIESLEDISIRQRRPGDSRISPNYFMRNSVPFSCNQKNT